VSGEYVDLAMKTCAVPLDLDSPLSEKGDVSGKGLRYDTLDTSSRYLHLGRRRRDMAVHHDHHSLLHEIGSGKPQLRA